MKAWVLDDIGNINLKEIDRPALKKGWVLVKVLAAGICGSDIPRIYRDGAHNMPLVPGHEFSGVVEEAVCEDGEKWIGKRVGIFPLIPCKECIPCRNKQYEMCRHYDYLGSRRDGGFAEYVAVPVWNLIELPDNVSSKAAAMLEPLAVSVHAIRQLVGRDEELKDYLAGKKIVVCGLGTIGLMLLTFILEVIDDKNNIFVIGNKESQKERIVDLGVNESHFIYAKEDVPGRIKELIGEPGPDIYYECVGNNKTISDGIDMVRPGGCVQLVGNPASDMTLDKNVYWKILRNQLTIKGTWNSSFTGSCDDDWHYVVERLGNGKIDAESLITHEYTMEDFRAGLELMRDKKSDYIKEILSPVK